jgi:hypothetical protein
MRKRVNLYEWILQVSSAQFYGLMFLDRIRNEEDHVEGTK